MQPQPDHKCILQSVMVGANELSPPSAM